MMKKIFLLCALLWSSLSLSAQDLSRHNMETAKQLEIFNALYKDLDLYYVDSLSAKTNIQNAIDYMLNCLDPYTEYYPEGETKTLQQLTTGQYAGIGAIISYRPHLKRCIIADPYQHQPAQEAGLRIGDQIMAIDGHDIPACPDKKWREYSDSVSNALRGQPGTTCAITVKRFGIDSLLHIKVVRRRITLPSVPYYTMLTPTTGYISLTTYSAQTTPEMLQAVRALQQQGMKRLIIDLRNNGGGLLNEAVSVVGMFIPKGKEVVSIKGKLSALNETFNTTVKPIDLSTDLIVLTNEGSASAAEITAGALQDYDRALIVGQRTYGKGLVQQTHPLPFDGILKLTTSKYFIPSGRCIQAYQYKNGAPVHLPDSVAQVFHTQKGRKVYDGGGITPDVLLPVDSLPTLLTELALSDEINDFVTQYQNSHPHLASPDSFEVDDATYRNFVAFLKQRQFTYDSRAKEIIRLLRLVAKTEGYAEVARPQIDALEKIMIHNFDHDFKFWEKHIRQLLSQQIIKRYYYAQGVIQYQLRHDPWIPQALQLPPLEKK